MSEPKAHSPTPWKHWQVTIPFNGWEIIGAKNQGITRLPGTRPEDEANARHICLCVNTHERLVGALKDASSLGEIVASIKYHDEKENVLLTREQLRRIEHVFCVANKILSEIEKGGAE